MKATLFLSTALLIAMSPPVSANAELAQSKNCMACHAIGNKLVGPAFKDVAKKYAGEAGADAKLSEKIMKGSVGVWGPVPMPANAHVTSAESLSIVKWIQSLN